MTYHGHVQNGKITLDPPAQLPEGAALKIEVLSLPGNGSVRSPENLCATLLRHAGKGINLPTDLAARHDFYAHGKPTP